MKIIAVIPARYKSSRFPGKPLADINGKPMIWWVYKEALKVKRYNKVIVATESDLIVDKCKELGIEVVKTSDKCLTGTDRVAEVAKKIKGDLYVVVMGDEPLMTYQEENKLIDGILKHKDADAYMLCTKFKNPVDVVNTTTIKLALNDRNYLIYMSRSPIPFPKDELGYDMYKNVGCYAFKKDALNYFAKTKAGRLERAEGLEMIRFLENHKKVYTVYVDSKSMSVDTYKDLNRIKETLR